MILHHLRVQLAAGQNAHLSAMPLAWMIVRIVEVEAPLASKIHLIQIHLHTRSARVPTAKMANVMVRFVSSLDVPALTVMKTQPSAWALTAKRLVVSETDVMTGAAHLPLA